MAERGIYVTGSVDKTVKIFDLNKGFLREIQMSEEIHGVKFLNEEGDLLIGHADKVSVLPVEYYEPFEAKKEVEREKGPGPHTPTKIALTDHLLKHMKLADDESRGISRRPTFKDHLRKSLRHAGTLGKRSNREPSTTRQESRIQSRLGEPSELDDGSNISLDEGSSGEEDSEEEEEAIDKEDMDRAMKAYERLKERRMRSAGTTKKKKKGKKKKKRRLRKKNPEVAKMTQARQLVLRREIMATAETHVDPRYLRNQGQTLASTLFAHKSSHTVLKLPLIPQALREGGVEDPDGAESLVTEDERSTASNRVGGRGKSANADPSVAHVMVDALPRHIARDKEFLRELEDANAPMTRREMTLRRIYENIEDHDQPSERKDYSDLYISCGGEFEEGVEQDSVRSGGLKKARRRFLIDAKGKPLVQLSALEARDYLIRMNAQTQTGRGPTKR
eukprot:CAMPEP_0115043298 /NCGR_PEP_ID=MMETSP0216-20121206/46791_1 /TAXON_ID=223996 /ORGANISM="Protocruzia adherens, Strain Boccale" /LENGTH=447 /DNA_ID=CAMNT_0002425603 /DNA_START=306 /DNA_END=1649 /DNA_ORIENTATION=+